MPRRCRSLELYASRWLVPGDLSAFGITDLFEGTASGRNLALGGGEIGRQAECLGGAEHSLSQLFDRPHLELPDPLA
jgi:hypothetical protein